MYASMSLYKDTQQCNLFYFPQQQQLSSWEPATCGKTEDHILASEQNHKYINTYPTRTLVM